MESKIFKLKQDKKKYKIAVYDGHMLAGIHGANFSLFRYQPDSPPRLQFVEMTSETEVTELLSSPGPYGCRQPRYPDNQTEFQFQYIFISAALILYFILFVLVFWLPIYTYEYF